MVEHSSDFINKEIQNLAQRITRERIAPGATERDLSAAFPRQQIQALGEAGLLGMGISEDHGGAPAGRALFAAVTAEIAKACASTALIYVSHLIAAKAIETAGSESSKKAWLPEMACGRCLGAFAIHESISGSNAGAIATQARQEGDYYIVNGSKFFITSAGEADAYVTLVRTDPAKGPQGMSLLLIEKNSPGLSFGNPEDKMGLRSTSSREMYFKDCRVPVENRIGAEGEGIQLVGKTVVGWGFFGAAGMAAGIARAAVDIAVKHANTRKIAGQPIAVHQAVQFLIADIIIGSEAAEAFLLSTAARADSAPHQAAVNGFKAKLFASETAVEVANKAMQVLGGHGYCRDYAVERLFRDARGLLVHFKTSEWLRQDIAKAALGL